MADISKIKPNGSTGTEYDIKDATARSALANKANDTQTFTEASTRANIASGESMATLFGKIKKFFTDLKTVAFTGSYNDLSNKPTIPAAQVNSDWNSSSGVSQILNKPDLSTYMVKGTDYVTAGLMLGLTIGTKATAEGYYNAANGTYSHVEGYYNIANGESAHAEGSFTHALGRYSHAEGYETSAESAYQHVEGKYNNLDMNAVYAHIIGNGTADNARSNAFTVSWDGDVCAGRSNGIDAVSNPLKLPTSLDIANYISNRTPKQITYNATTLASAASEQNLAKYGYSIGDYWTDSNSYKYVIADMDTFYGGYILNAVVNTHHIAILVVTGATSQWNTSDTTTTGYNGSALHTYLKGTVLPKVKTSLGSSHILAHSKVLTTNVSSWAWQSNQEISALTEVQIYGARVFGIDGCQTGEGCKKLAVFDKYCFNQIFGNQWIWLRSVASASAPCAANHDVAATTDSASTAGGVVGLILFK